VQGGSPTVAIVVTVFAVFAAVRPGAACDAGLRSVAGVVSRVDLASPDPRVLRLPVPRPALPEDRLEVVVRQQGVPALDAVVTSATISVRLPPHPELDCPPPRRAVLDSLSFLGVRDGAPIRRDFDVSALDAEAQETLAGGRAMIEVRIFGPHGDGTVSGDVRVVSD
jgi:hypothetical protein